MVANLFDFGSIGPLSHRQFLDALDGELGDGIQSYAAVPFYAQDWDYRLNLVLGRLSLFQGWNSSELQFFKQIQDNRVNNGPKKSEGMLLYNSPDIAGLKTAYFINNPALSSHFVSLLSSKSLAFMQPVLTHNKMKYLLKAFEKASSFSYLAVTQTSSFVKRSGKSKAGKPRTASTSSLRRWGSSSIDDAFELAEEQNERFKSVHLRHAFDDFVVLTTSVHRNGVIKGNGHFSKVRDYLLKPIVEALSNSVALYSNRSRKESPTRSTSPLSLYLKEPSDNVPFNEYFISIMRKLSDTSVSVYHGNPYLYMSVFDYTDGSTYDLWRYHGSEVVIVPQMKASAYSLNRIISHIYQHYSEGVVKDYKNEGDK